MNNKMFFMWFNLIFVVLLYGAVEEGEIDGNKIKQVALKKLKAGFLIPGLKKPFQLAVVDVPRFLIRKTKEHDKAILGCWFLGSLLGFLLYKDGYFKRGFDYLSNKEVFSNFNIYPNFIDFDRKTSLIITWLSFVFSSSIVHSYIRYDENKSLLQEASINDEFFKEYGENESILRRNGAGDELGRGGEGTFATGRSVTPS